MIQPELAFRTLIPSLDGGSSNPIVWSVDSELPYFNGHFPQNPILPAIAIVDASTLLLKRVLQKPDLRFKSVASAKFLSPISPGQRVSITWQALSEGEWRVDWKENETGRVLATLCLEA